MALAFNTRHHPHQDPSVRARILAADIDGRWGTEIDRRRTFAPGSEGVHNPFNPAGRMADHWRRVRHFHRAVDAAEYHGAESAADAHHEAGREQVYLHNRARDAARWAHAMKANPPD